MIATTLLAWTLMLSGSNASLSPVPNDTPAAVANVSRDALQLALRDLWDGHIFWVRSYVLAAHYRDEAGAAVADAQTVQNARALADAIVPFYGKEAADQLFQLLAGHYGAIKDYRQASYAGEDEAREEASKRLSANADEIATFLGGANPHLPKEAVLPLLLAHGGHHLQQIEAFREGDFAAEAEVWEAMGSHMHAIADALGAALARQFPDKVTG
jgi:hypothetical protein